MPELRGYPQFNDTVARSAMHEWNLRQTTYDPRSIRTRRREPDIKAKNAARSEATYKTPLWWEALVRLLAVLLGSLLLLRDYVVGHCHDGRHCPFEAIKRRLGLTTGSFASSRS